MLILFKFKITKTLKKNLDNSILQFLLIDFFLKDLMKKRGNSKNLRKFK